MAINIKLFIPMEIIAEILLEFLIQIIGEVLFEFGLRSLKEPFRQPPNPWVAAVGYLIFGGFLGGLSLWLFPHYMVSSPVWRWVNLLATPLIAAIFMAQLGAWRARRGQTLLRIDRYSYGYLFALSFTAVRFTWAVQ